MQEIIKSSHIADDLEKVIKSIHHDKLFVLTDEHTSQLCFPVIEPLESVKNAAQVVIPADDTNKTIENLQRVWQFLTENGASRHSLLINLGGGMFTGLGGFAAATFKRGINTKIPTTILGAGGCGVGEKPHQFYGNEKRNRRFYPTEYVILLHIFHDHHLITSFRDSEMIKHDIITPNSIGKTACFSADGHSWEEMHELFIRSVSIKERIVEKDPFEQNIPKH
jgi:3-dehydroquinate synthase